MRPEPDGYDELLALDGRRLREVLAHSEIPALLMTVAHLTGDAGILPDDLRTPGWLTVPQGGLDETRRLAAVEAAAAALDRLRGPVPAPGRPDPELLRAIVTWAMGPDVDDLLPMIAEEIALPAHDPKAPSWRLPDVIPQGGGEPFEVAIVGAGFSGLLAAYRLSQAEVPFVIYEKNPDVGGTWFENTYPGCRTDVASHLYNYSFAPNADWPDFFCRHDVVLDYLRDFVKEAALTEHIEFGTEVRALQWDDRAGTWQVRTRGPRGEGTRTFRAVISAVGQLNRPRTPDIPGRGEFRGAAFHSARWDHSVDLAGKRVAVIGTGASAFQIVPEIAGSAAELVVVQRNPPWLRPTPTYRDPVSPEARFLYHALPFYLQWHRFWLLAPGLRGILEGWIVDGDFPPTERSVSALNEQIRTALEQAMLAQLVDAPWLTEKVIPRYPVGAKRVLRDDGSWLATLKRADVQLVTAPIDRMTSTGIVAGGEHIDVDVVVYATGFEASRFLAPMQVTGRDGVDLHEMWNGEPRAYLGISIPRFPGFYCMYGPNTNLVGQGGSIVYFAECAISYILDAVRRQATGVVPEVRQDAHDRYNTWVDEASGKRSWGWSKVGGWYNEDGRSATNWPFTASEYWHRTRTVDPAVHHFLRYGSDGGQPGGVLPPTRRSGGE
ncbi:flavin-containing monooxygenase [Parafrankia sp. FMc2]|uniref:flavin-containing monooxygenase n=1 Tax=Parafrankia sp. FMc2 TaxID=3233196 RepID=UPI0034D5B364